MATVPIPLRAISAALSRRAYAEDRVRLTGATLDGHECLVASRQGLFAVSRNGRVTQIAHGFFFGICAVADLILLFEACDRPHAGTRMGRIVRLRRQGARLTEPTVLAKGLDSQCHQIAMFDGSIWLVDTAGQAILQFATDGTAISRHTPFPPASPDDTSGVYLHLNSLARIGNYIAVMLHNGNAIPSRLSELAWLDLDWMVLSREPLAGHGCHDIVADEAGMLWHCGSMAGELINSTGLRVKVSDRMTRGLAVTPNTVIVGNSNFGARDRREELAGSVIFLSRDFSVREEIELPAAPTGLIVL